MGGASPNVRLFHELTAPERRADFKAKDSVLSSSYPQIPASLFYSDFLFHDMNEEEFSPSIIIYGEDGDGRSWRRQAVRIDDLVDYFDRDDVAVNPCGYWNDYPKAKLMRRVYAFAMDVDEVRPDTLSFLLKMIENEEFPRPTVITNSGSGVHFFFVLDVALQVGYYEKYLQNFKLAQQIYFMLHKRLGNLYAGVQKHHLGQDYRVVGSRTKFGDVTTAWESGSFWKVEDLAAAVGVDAKEYYQPQTRASAQMQNYARSIAKDLQLEMPDVSAPREVYDFIAKHKDEAYKARTRRRDLAGKKRKGMGGWYKDTWFKVYTKTKAGNRFNALRGLAIVAVKCGISEERFEHDLYQLSTLWQEKIWKDGDPFNSANVEDILRMFRNGERYRKTSRARLEEMFGWKWSGKSKKREKPLKQADHVKVMNTFRDIKYPNGTWRYKGGAPTAQAKVQKFRAENPEASKAACIRATGLSKPTVYKWWDA